MQLRTHAECRALTGLARQLAATVRRSPRPLAVGEHPYRQGDRADHLFLVLDGRVQESVTSRRGRELVLQTAGPGNIVGELCFCEVRYREEAATAVEASRVAPVYAEDLIAYARGTQAGALDVLEYLMHRVAELTARIQELAFDDVERRVLRRLAVRAALAVGPPTDVVVLPPLTHDEWAAEVYATREQVTAILTRLRREGLIAYRARGPITVDEAALQARLDPPGTKPPMFPR